jgi:hypothetical protein
MPPHVHRQGEAHDTDFGLVALTLAIQKQHRHHRRDGASKHSVWPACELSPELASTTRRSSGGAAPLLAAPAALATASSPSPMRACLTTDGPELLRIGGLCSNLNAYVQVHE